MTAPRDLAALLNGRPNEEPQPTRIVTAVVTAVASPTAPVTLAGGESVVLPYVGTAPTVGKTALILAYGPVRVILGTFA